VKRLSVLRRYHIPVPVVGGLLVAVLVLISNLTGGVSIAMDLAVDSRAWNWLIVPEPLLIAEPSPSRTVYLPFMFAFFTCVGLNASWSLVKKGSWPLVLFLITVSVFAAIQTIVGVAIASGMGANPLLGLAVGAVSMTGGHGTSGAFAPLLADAGLPGAMNISLAAATFGLVAGGLLGGPIAGWLIRRHGLASLSSSESPAETNNKRTVTFVQNVLSLVHLGRTALLHLLLLAVMLKVGAWVSYFIEQVEIAGQPLRFPGYIGAMIVGIVVRNVLEASGRHWIRTHIVSSMMFVSLGVFLAAAMMSLDLIQLADVAVPMIAILLCQVVLMAVFAGAVTFRLMGGDYDASVIAAGHCGFALGATPNAVANMETLVKRFEPSPKSFLIVPIVGAFLLDFTNALVITVSLNLF
jgi:ESS family glutamate:Na+ symporter